MAANGSQQVTSCSLWLVLLQNVHRPKVVARNGLEPRWNRRPPRIPSVLNSFLHLIFFLWKEEKRGKSHKRGESNIWFSQKDSSRQSSFNKKVPFSKKAQLEIIIFMKKSHLTSVASKWRIHKLAIPFDITNFAEHSFSIVVEKCLTPLKWLGKHHFKG